MNDAEYKQYTMRIIHAIGKLHASNSQQFDMARAAQYTIVNTASDQHLSKAAVPMGQQKFIEFLAQAAAFDAESDIVFAPFHNVIADFKNEFDTMRNLHEAEYERDYPKMNIIGLLLEDARKIWSEKNAVILEKLSRGLPTL